MSAPTVVFFGYGPLALAGIDTLARVGAGLALVVVPANRSGAAVDEVAALAARHAIPVAVQPRRSEIAPFASRLRALAPDVMIVWSYSMLLQPDLLTIPRHGAVNVHTGLLPTYRGGHVLQWALLNGEPETGVTLHYMDAGVDTGPMIAETRFPIAPDDDAVRVKEKLKDAGVRLLREWWPRIANGTAPRIPQDESRARTWPLRRPEDGLIDLTRPAAEVCRLVRALNTNDPGAYLDVAGRRICVTRAEPAVTVVENGLLLPAADGDVVVTEASIDGRRLEPSELLNLRDLVSHHQPGR